MLAIILAFLLCVPDVHMTKAAFLECVKHYQDEYHVAKQHGVPRSVEKTTPGDPSEYDWVYVRSNGQVGRFHFGSLGQLMWEALFVPPKAH